MFWYQSYSVKGQLVVAICDENLLGKMIGKNSKVNVSKDFYGRERIDEKKALEMIKKSTICNLMGKKIVELALQRNFITKENIMFIDDIPHTQFIK